MPNTPLHFHTIAELAALIQSRQISPVEVTQTLLERIAQLDRRYKSYATVMADQAVQAARGAEQEISAGAYRGPLHGVPVAVKDLCYTQGVRTMGGSRALADHVPSFNATVVARLYAAGAILLGKLNLTEGAMGGYHPDFDIPVNPWHAERYAGASSSGSGVATAAGLCLGSLGSDTGGSIRFPAAACGNTLTPSPARRCPRHLFPSRPRGSTAPCPGRVFIWHACASPPPITLMVRRPCRCRVASVVTGYR